MVQILRYRDFSDSHFVIEAEEGKTIEQATGLLNWSNHIVIVNGKKESEKYKIKENDCIIIRSVPKKGGGWDVVWGVVTGGIYTGIKSYKQAKEAKKAADEAEEALRKLKNVTHDDISNVPYIKGASNTVATGKTQPYIIGRHLFTPYILNAGGNNYKGYHTIGGELGEDSFYNVVLEGGFNKQVIESISFDDIKVSTLAQSTPQENNSANPRFSFNSNSEFASNDSFVEIAQDGKPFENSFFNTKIVEQEVSDELKKKNATDYKDLYYTLEMNARACDVCIMFNGLYSMNNEGTKSARIVTIVPEYSFDYAQILAEGRDTTRANFRQFPYSFKNKNTYTTTFQYQEEKQLRFEAHHDFSFNEIFTRDENGEYKPRQYPITIRLRCETDKVTSGSEVSECYTQYIHSYCIDVEKSKNAGSFVDEKIIGDNEAAKSTLIGVHVKGTLSNEDKIKKINVITNGIAPVPTYNETSKLYEWDISKKVMTSNPASWLIEVLTSETHTASKVSLEEIDLQSFGELYDYCEKNNFEVNKILISSTKKSEVLKLILSVCHATLYQNIYGKITVAIDNEKENAIALLNEQNIISFSWEKDIALDVDGVRVKYIDEDSDFQENSFVTLYGDKEYNENSVLRELDFSGITNSKQAYRHAHYTMANDKLRPLNVTAKIGNEGIYFTPFSKIFIQHPSLKIGLGNATVKNIIVDENDIIIGVDLYDAIELDTEYEHCIIIQCVGENYCTPISRRLKEIEKVIEYKESPFRTHENQKVMLSDGTPLMVRLDSTKVFVTSLYFETGIALDSPVIPHRGDVLSFGYELETVSRAFTVNAIKPNGNTGYTLELVDYNESIFDFDESKIPEYHQLITTRRPKTGKQVPSIEDIQEYERVLIQAISTERIITNTPKYLGLLSSLPENPNVNDYFTAKVNFNTFKAGRVYKYNNSRLWELLDEEKSENSKEFMSALNDILSVTSSTGYFSAIFANTLIANDAFINKLAASIITLQQDSSGNGGVIRSSNFLDSKGNETGNGWQIDYNGNAKFNNGIFNGEIHATSGTFNGEIHATSGTFNGEINATNGNFSGLLKAGDLSTRIVGGIFFIDQDTNNTASATNNITMGKVYYTSNVKRVIKCGKGKYVIVFYDTILQYIKDIGKVSFSIRNLYTGDKLYTVKSSYGNETAKIRYGDNHYQCSVSAVQAIYNQTTGMISVEDYYYICDTLDSNNLPIFSSSFWFNGSLLEQCKINGETYYAIGLIVLDRNTDAYISAVGGCKLIIEISMVE